jgi:hypothetical protein
MKRSGRLLSAGAAVGLTLGGWLLLGSACLAQSFRHDPIRPGLPKKSAYITPTTGLVNPVTGMPYPTPVGYPPTTYPLTNYPPTNYPLTNYPLTNYPLYPTTTYPGYPTLPYTQNPLFPYVPPSYPTPTFLPNPLFPYVPSTPTVAPNPYQPSPWWMWPYQGLYGTGYPNLPFRIFGPGLYE